MPVAHLFEEGYNLLREKLYGNSARRSKLCRGESGIRIPETKEFLKHNQRLSVIIDKATIPEEFCKVVRSCFKKSGNARFKAIRRIFTFLDRHILIILTIILKTSMRTWDRNKT